MLWKLQDQKQQMIREFYERDLGVPVDDYEIHITSEVKVK